MQATKLDYATIAEGADAVRISHWTLRQWLSAGKLPRYKVGARTLIRMSELLALVKPESRAEAAARNIKREALRHGKH